MFYLEPDELAPGLRLPEEVVKRVGRIRSRRFIAEVSKKLL
jgi:hypothetical protein